MEWPSQDSERLLADGDARERVGGSALTDYRAAYGAAAAVSAEFNPRGAGVGSALCALDESVMTLVAVAYAAGVRFGAAAEVWRGTLEPGD